MKRVLMSLVALSMFISAPSTLVSCLSSETRDRSKISLTLFKNELALIPVFMTEDSTKKVTEEVFQKAFYWGLETDEYRGDPASDELEFVYYNKDLTPIDWTDLLWATADKIEKTPSVLVQIIATSTSSHFADKTEIIRTTLYKTKPQLLDSLTLKYDEKVLKTLSVAEIMSYLAVQNPTVYCSERHFKIIKTPNRVTITAVPTSGRYQGEKIINFN